MIEDKISSINKVIELYFKMHPYTVKVQAKELMPEFIKASVFDSNQKDGLPIRRVLRMLDRTNQLHLIPHVFPERKLKNTNWFFRNSIDLDPIQHIEKRDQKQIVKKSISNARKDSDEHYVIGLCDNILGITGLRQHRFDFLLGDANPKGKCAKLPVDVYYPVLNLVLEFQEQQHSKPVKLFDKPDVMTVSGVHRGEQRRIYDHRKVEVLPKHSIQLIVISFETFNCTHQNKIIRNFETDLLRVKGILNEKA